MLILNQTFALLLTRRAKQRSEDLLSWSSETRQRRKPGRTWVACHSLLWNKILL